MDTQHNGPNSHQERPTHASGTQAADALRPRLISGESGWQYGDILPSEARLAQELGVARGTIREALALLAAEGWLDLREARPTVKREVNPLPGPMSVARRVEVLEVIEARRALECECARLAALRRSGENLEAIGEALLRRRAAVAERNLRSVVAADTAFHAEVVRAAGNSLIQRLFSSLDREITALLIDVHAHDLTSADSSAAHEDLAVAIELQDPEGAVLATRRQFVAAEQRFRRSEQG